MKNLRTIDYKLGITDRKVMLLSRLNPTNPNKEKKKFLYAHKRGIEYNPFFRYKPISVNLDSLEDELRSMFIKIPSHVNEEWFFAKFLENKRKRTMEKIQSIRQRGEPKFARHAKKLFGEPSTAQIHYAASHLVPVKCAPFSRIKNTIPSWEVAKTLQNYIEKTSLPWKAKLRISISSRAGLDSRSKYLLIKTGEWFSKEEIESLAVHEIETHIFRKENGEAQSFPYLFGQGFAGPPTIEEGLAFFNETQQTVYDPRRFLIICARTIASHLAAKKSFYKTFDALVRRGLPVEYAWSTTLRTKRGFADTSKPGSFPKDHHYLKGYLEIKKYIDLGGDLGLLYIGRVNPLTVKSLTKLGVETKKPKYLPKHLNNANSRPIIS